MSADKEKPRKSTKTTSSKEKSTSGEKRVKKSSATSKDDANAKTHKLALKGSSKIVSEFFEYSIHSILFQRGVYPAEDFSPVKKYGLTMMVSADDQVQAYIKKIMTQLRKWMQGAKINKLVIVVTSRETGEHVERWQFDIDIFGKTKPAPAAKPSPSPSASTPAAAAADDDQTENNNEDENDEASKQQRPRDPSPPKEKTEAEIQSEIQSLFRQITASVTFLPMLDGNCTFNVLVYADADSDVPVEWGDSDAKEIEGGEKVQLRSFSTSQHKVDTVVSYRMAD
ncbi:DNA-binding protein [Phyllosticta citribraziliensis]|uniref:DNA-binding protein n=1 Tax=Phyllosticta citribraziliensis TaxID=989973 RepID=A0ABR1LKI4_9PEZI